MAEEKIGSPSVPAAPAAVAPQGTPAAPAVAAPPAFDPVEFEDRIVKKVASAFKTDPDIAWLYNPPSAPMEAEPDPFAAPVPAQPQAQPGAPPAAPQPVTMESLAAELRRTQDYIRQRDKDERENAQRTEAQRQFHQSVGGLVSRSPLMQGLTQEQQGVVGRRMMSLAREIDQATGARLEYPDLVQKVEQELGTLRNIWVPPSAPAPTAQPGQLIPPPPRSSGGVVTPTNLGPVSTKGQWNRQGIAERVRAVQTAPTTP